jgi:hypothetical protein
MQFNQPVAPAGVIRNRIRLTSRLQALSYQITSMTVAFAKQALKCWDDVFATDYFINRLDDEPQR